MQDLLKLELDREMWDHVKNAPRSRSSRRLLKRLYTARAVEMGAVA